MYKKQLFSISQLAIELDLDRRTVTAKLRDVASDGMLSGHPAFHLSTAVGAIYCASTSTREEIDRERLLALQTERKIRDRELVPAADIEKNWLQIVGMIRNAILGLPRKMATQLSRSRTPEEAEQVLTTEVRSILSRLAAANGNPA
jgi:DNA-binding transcriptional MocR family regulator